MTLSPSRPPLLLIALLAACDADQSSETGWNAAPLITGGYQAFLEGATGCGGSYEVVTDWAEGPLSIRGDGPRTLTYDFGQDMAFAGSVDESWSYQFGGSGTWMGYNLSIHQAGVFTEEDERFVMTGDFSVIVDEDGNASNDCTITARMSARQISD